MKNIKLFRKDFQVWKNRIYILPTIEIVINDIIYAKKNYSICFHWLVFHGGFLFLESEENNE